MKNGGSPQCGLLNDYLDPNKARISHTDTHLLSVCKQYIVIRQKHKVIDGWLSEFLSTKMCLFDGKVIGQRLNCEFCVIVCVVNSQVNDYGESFHCFT